MSSSTPHNGGTSTTTTTHPPLWERPPLSLSTRDYCTSVTTRGRGSSTLDRELWRRWDAAHEAGELNYAVTDVLTDTLPGQYGLVLQLNPSRVSKRRKPYPFVKLRQPFDNSTFNFTKIKDRELLFNVNVNTGGGDGAAAAVLRGSVIVNTAPICASHCLLLPWPAECRPQLIDARGLHLAVALVMLSNTSSLRMAFNSLCAYASVNHFHFHTYYLHRPLHVETAECLRVVGPCHRFTNHHAPGFVFQVTAANVEEAVRDSMKLIDYLVAHEIPHNVFITRGAPVQRHDIPGSSSPSGFTTVTPSTVTNGSQTTASDGGATNGSQSQPWVATSAANGAATATNGAAAATNGAPATANGAPATANGLPAANNAVVRLCVWARESTAGIPDPLVFATAVCEFAGHVPVYSRDAWGSMTEGAITTEVSRVCTPAYEALLPHLHTIYANGK